MLPLIGCDTVDVTCVVLNSGGFMRRSGLIAAMWDTAAPLLVAAEARQSAQRPRLGIETPPAFLACACEAIE